MKPKLESVYRTSPLPRGDLYGQFLVTDCVFDATREALISFALAGIQDRGHEGLVYWAGRELGRLTIFISAIIPRAEHSAQRVFVQKEHVGTASRAARSRQLGLLCQVHSHPSSDTRHSEGDDKMILLPFEGMLSIVAPDYGISLHDISNFGVHQYQGGRWVWCSEDSVKDNLIKVPSAVDLR